MSFPCLAPTPQGLGEQGDWARAREDRERSERSVESRETRAMTEETGDWDQC